MTNETKHLLGGKVAEEYIVMGTLPDKIWNETSREGNDSTLRKGAAEHHCVFHTIKVTYY